MYSLNRDPIFVCNNHMKQAYCLLDLPLYEDIVGDARMMDTQIFSVFAYAADMFALSEISPMFIFPLERF
jgi:hypothetical protein